MTQLPAVSHVALTVTDLARSVPWYERLLGTKPVLDKDTNGFHHTVYLLPGGTLLALHQHPDRNLGISRMLPATRVSSLTTEQTGRSIRNGNGNLRRHQDP